MLKVKELRSAIEEMIEVMELTEEKKGKEVLVSVPEDTDAAKLINMIKEAANEIQKGDVFSEETQSVIDEVTGKTTKPPKRAKAEPADAEDLEEKRPVRKVYVEEPEGDDPEDDEQEEKPAKKGVIKEKKVVKEKSPSPYGTAVEVMCTDPDMKLEELIKKLQKKGIDTVAGKSAVQTGFGVVRKITSLLRENGLMK